jgi:hypothetical protein
MKWDVVGAVLGLLLGFAAGCVAIFCAFAVAAVFKVWLFERPDAPDPWDMLFVGLLWLGVYGGLGWYSLRFLTASTWTIAGALVPLLFCSYGFVISPEFRRLVRDSRSK